MAVTVGAVYVEVLPSAKDFVKEMLKDILPEADKAGKEIGERVGKAFDDEVKKEIKDSIEEGVEESDPEDESAKKGKKAGGAFAKTFKAELQAALRSLPDADIDGDNTGALAEVAEVRAAIASLSKQTVGVSIDAEDGLRAVRRIREDLIAIQDRTIDVDFDIDSALASLGKLEQGMLRTFQDSQGSFARSIRGAIDSAVRALPDIKLDADTSDVEQDLAVVRSWLAELADKRIDIDISTEEAVLELVRIDEMLDGLEGPHNIRVQTDIDAARAALAKFTQDVTEDVAEAGERSVGAFVDRWRRELTKAAGTLPDIEVGADTTPALAEVARLRAELLKLAARIGVDVDGAQAFTELGLLQAAADALDTTDIDIAVRSDLASVIAQMAALRGVAAVTAEAVDEAVGERAAGRVGRFRLMLTAIIALLPLIAGAVVALPAIFAAIVGPVLAIAAGAEGIKAAFSELTPVVNEIKEATSAAFEQGLAPTVERLRQSIPSLTDDIVRTAEALSYVAEQITITATSAKSLNGIQDNFYLINEIIRQSAPWLQLFTENIIRLTTIGLQGMDTFGEEMRQVGEVWAGVIARLQESGAGEAAVRGLLQVLAELLNLAAGLTEFGAVLGAAFGPALAAAISGLAQIFVTFAGTLDSLPEPLQTIASIATVVGLAMLVLGTRITTAAVAMRTGLVSAGTAVLTTFRLVSGIIAGTSGSLLGVSAAARVAGVSLGIAAAAARTLWTALGGGVGIAITALVIGLSALGQSQADAAAEAEAHRAAVEQLSSALAASGGVIDSQVVKLTASTLEAKNLGAEMALLGQSVGGVSLAVAQGGPSYEALIAHLQGVVAAGTEMKFSGTEVTTALNEEGLAAQALLGVIEPMRQTFIDAAAENTKFAQSLFSTGQSLADGVGSAKLMEEAFATLANEMSTVKEKGDALYITMLQLTGQAVPAGLAQGQLGQAVRDVALSFDAYKEATSESHDTLLTATGGINVASKAGLDLATKLQDLGKAGLTSAAAVFENAGGMDNLAAASAAAAREIQFSRDALIAQAMEAGATRVQAEALADSYGLLPNEVVTLLRAEGIPQVTQDLLTVSQRVTALPNEKVIGVGALTTDAIAKLQALGITVQQVVGGDGGYEVVIQDQAARDKLTALIQSILHPSTPPELPTKLDTKPAEADKKRLGDGFASGPPAEQPTVLDTTKVPPQTEAMRTDVSGTVAELPINPIKGSGWDPDLAAIQQSALTIVATMPINPIKGSGWDTEIALIRDSVVTTVGAMPIDAARSVNFDSQLQFIRTTVVQGAPAALPITVAHAPNFAETLSAITAPLLAPPYSALFITVMKAPTFDADLQAIKNSINALTPGIEQGGVPGGGAVPALQISVAKSATFEADLQAIKDSINAAVQGVQEGGVGGETAALTTALQITVAKAATFDADLQLIKDSINGPAAAAGAEPGAAAAAVTALLITVAKAPTWDLDLQLIKDSINGPAVAAPGGAGVLPGATGAPALLITVAKAPTWDFDLAAIKASINGGVAGVPGTMATPLLVTVAKALTFDMDLLAIRNLITTPPALPTMLTVGIIIDTTNLDAFLQALPTVVTYFTVTADIGPAIDVILTLLDAIQQTITFFTVVADTVPAQNMVIELINWISSLVVPITVIAQFGGFGGLGMSQGGVASGGNTQDDFDAASAATQRLGGGSSFPSNNPGGGGGGFVNPGAALDTSGIDDLRNKYGRIVLAMMATGGMMSNSVATVVPPNTWRVIGDRIVHDEAFIPINGAPRSHKILAYTAARMGYNLMPQASGSFMTQQSGSFNGQSTWDNGEQGGNPWTQGGAPLIGQLIADRGASATDLADEVMFRLRVNEYGGVNGVRR